VALAFVAACNARDGARLAAILHPDVVFQDSRGGRLEGAQEVLAALSRVNDIAPDLRVEIDKTVERGELVLLTGRSITAVAALATDTQWSATVRKGKLVEWQAFGRKSEGSLVGFLHSLDADEGGK
jgi:ketosteroid isomerase-like protein